MGPPESPAEGRVDVPIPIRLPVMQAMMRCPPQNPLLRGTLGQERHGKLSHSAQLVTPVPEIAMIARRYAKHADCVGRGKPSQQGKRRRGPPHQQQSRMKQNEEENSPELVPR